MAENELEATIDLLAKYGEFNREYLRDKLLTFANDGRSESKNKMQQVAALFGKRLGEEFTAVIYDAVMSCKFTHNGLKIKMSDGWHTSNGGWLSCLLTGDAVIMCGGG